MPGELRDGAAGGRVPEQGRGQGGGALPAGPDAGAQGGGPVVVAPGDERDEGPRQDVVTGRRQPRPEPDQPGDGGRHVAPVGECVPESVGGVADGVREAPTRRGRQHRPDRADGGVPPAPRDQARPAHPQQAVPDEQLGPRPEARDEPGGHDEPAGHPDGARREEADERPAGRRVGGERRRDHHQGRRDGRGQDVGEHDVGRDGHLAHRTTSTLAGPPG